MISPLLAWSDIDAYLKETRERIILDLSDADSDKAVWRNLGKLSLLDELANLHAILATLNAQKKEG